MFHLIWLVSPIGLFLGNKNSKFHRKFPHQIFIRWEMKRIPVLRSLYFGVDLFIIKTRRREKRFTERGSANRRTDGGIFLELIGAQAFVFSSRKRERRRGGCNERTQAASSITAAKQSVSEQQRPLFLDLFRFWLPLAGGPSDGFHPMSVATY